MDFKKIFTTREHIWNDAQVGEWLDAKFLDEETGEVFFVEFRKEQDETMEDFITRCCFQAKEYFNAPRCIGLCDQATAEILGYDTY